MNVQLKPAPGKIQDSRPYNVQIKIPGDLCERLYTDPILYRSPEFCKRKMQDNCPHYTPAGQMETLGAKTTPISTQHHAETL